MFFILILLHAASVVTTPTTCFTLDTSGAGAWLGGYHVQMAGGRPTYAGAAPFTGTFFDADAGTLTFAHNSATSCVWYAPRPYTGAIDDASDFEFRATLRTQNSNAEGNRISLIMQTSALGVELVTSRNKALDAQDLVFEVAYQSKSTGLVIARTYSGASDAALLRLSGDGISTQRGIDTWIVYTYADTALRVYIANIGEVRPENATLTIIGDSLSAYAAASPHAVHVGFAAHDPGAGTDYAYISNATFTCTGAACCVPAPTAAPTAQPTLSPTPPPPACDDLVPDAQGYCPASMTCGAPACTCVCREIAAPENTSPCNTAAPTDVRFDFSVDDGGFLNASCTKNAARWHYGLLSDLTSNSIPPTPLGDVNVWTSHDHTEQSTSVVNSIRLTSPQLLITAYETDELVIVHYGRVSVHTGVESNPVITTAAQVGISTQPPGADTRDDWDIIESYTTPYHAHGITYLIAADAYCGTSPVSDANDRRLWDGNFTQNAWIESRFDLSPYVGQTVRFGFYLYTPTAFDTTPPMGWSLASMTLTSPFSAPTLCPDIVNTFPSCTCDA